VNWLRQLVGLPVGCFLPGIASEIGVGACAPKTQPGAPWESPFRALCYKTEFWAPGCILGLIWLTARSTLGEPISSPGFKIEFWAPGCIRKVVQIWKDEREDTSKKLYWPRSILTGGHKDELQLLQDKFDLKRAPESTQDIYLKGCGY
jgi:hypothetical protein